MAAGHVTPRRRFFGDAIALRIERLSWGAIIAGAVCALALQIVFALMSAGLGLSLAEDGGAGGAGAAAGVFFAITALISLAAGGAIAGRMSGSPHVAAAALHGVVVWALVMLGVTWTGVSATGALLRGATQAAQAAGGAVANLAGSAGQAVGDVAGALTPDLENLEAGDLQAMLPASVEQDLRELTAGQNLTPEQFAQETREIAGAIVEEADLREARSIVVDAGRQMLRQPGEAEAIFEDAVARMTAPDGPLGEQQFDELQGELRSRYGIDEAQSAEIAERWRGEFVAARDELIATWRETYQSAATTVNEAAEAAAAATSEAAEAAASAAWWAAFGSIVGLVAAGAGAAFARPDEEDAEVVASRPGAPAGPRR